MLKFLLLVHPNTKIQSLFIIIQNIFKHLLRVNILDTFDNNVIFDVFL